MTTNQPSSLIDPATGSDYDYAVMYKRPEGVTLHRSFCEKRLARLAVPYESKLVNTRFGFTHVLVCGPAQAAPLVLVHSMAGDATEWEHQIAFFSQHYRLYVLDVPGASPRSAPVHIAFFNSDWAIWLLEVLHELEVKKANFVATGVGCGVVIKLAGLVPGYLNSVALVEPFNIAPLRRVSSLKLLVLVQLAVLFPRPATIKRYIKAACARKSRLDDATMQEQIEHFQLFTRYCKFSGAFPTFSNEDLSKLRGPTLLLLAKENKFRRLADITSRIRRAIPHLKLAVVPDAGVDILVEQPQAVNKAIAEFLHSVPNISAQARLRRLNRL